jgi:hypothetical protein
MGIMGAITVALITTLPIFTFPLTTGWDFPGGILSTTMDFTTTSTAIIIPGTGVTE